MKSNGLDEIRVKASLILKKLRVFSNLTEIYSFIFKAPRISAFKIT